MMTIVDAQIHVWSADTPSRPWPLGRAAYAHGPSLDTEQVLRVMDGAGVARAVLVPPSWIGDDNSDALAAARAHPARFAVMGRFDPTAPGAVDRLQRWLAEPGMLGIRLTFHLPVWQAWLGDGSPSRRRPPPSRRVSEAFGPARMLWGTDYSRLPCPYAGAVRLFTEALDFSAGDRAWIMGRATAEWLGWRA